MIAPTASLRIDSSATLPPPGLPNGVAAGDVTQDRVVLWARAGQRGVVTFTVSGSDLLAVQPITRTVADPLRPVTATLTGLSPATAYTYEVSVANGDRIEGRFHTPADDVRAGLRFGASGDVRGDFAPYPAVANVPDRGLDFFVMLGDSVYADIPSPALFKQAQTLDEFLTKQAEVLATHAELNTLGALRGATALFATIDDHDVLNNFAGGMPAADSPYFADNAGLVNEDRLYRAGLEAFLAYHPLQVETYSADGEAARMQGRPKLYRYRTFGADAALFVMDMRSFRDAPLGRSLGSDAAGRAHFLEAAFDPGRTLLGDKQFADLKRDLADAQARGITWKFVALPDPIQQLDMTAAQDRWQGYAAERSALLGYIAEKGIDNVVFIAADIHGTVVNNLTYQDGAHGASRPVAAWEITVGPVAAYETFGLAILWTYRQLGLLSAEDEVHYWSLPMRPDGDDEPDDRDDFVKQHLNDQLAALGYNPIGLNDAANIEASLLAGDYFAGEVYGWSEFEIAAQSQVLTVTTFGIPAYQARDVAFRLDEVVTAQPQIVSRFSVLPQRR